MIERDNDTVPAKNFVYKFSNDFLHHALNITHAVDFVNRVIKRHLLTLTSHWHLSKIKRAILNFKSKQLFYSLPNWYLTYHVSDVGVRCQKQRNNINLITTSINAVWCLDR